MGTGYLARTPDVLRAFMLARLAEDEVPLAELCREHGLNDAAVCKWRANYGGMDEDPLVRQ